MPESVTGEFLPQDTEEAWAVQREDGSWLLCRLPEPTDKIGTEQESGVEDREETA